MKGDGIIFGENQTRQQTSVICYFVLFVIGFLDALQVGDASNNLLYGQQNSSTCKFRQTTVSKLGSDLVTIPESLYYQARNFNSNLFSVQLEEDVLDGASTEDFLPFAALIQEHFPTIFIFATIYKSTPRAAASFLKINQPTSNCGHGSIQTRIYLSVLLDMVQDGETHFFERLNDTIATAQRINTDTNQIVVGIAVYLHLMVQQPTLYNEFLPWNQVDRHVSTMRSLVNAAGLSFGSIVWSDALSNKVFYSKWQEHVFPHLEFIYFQYWPCDSTSLKPLAASGGLPLVIRQVFNTHEQLVTELYTQFPQNRVKVGINMYFMDCQGLTASFEEAAKMWMTLNNYATDKLIPVTISPVITKDSKTFAEWWRVIGSNGGLELSAYTNLTSLSPLNDNVTTDNPKTDKMLFEEFLFGSDLNTTRCTAYRQVYIITNQYVNFPDLNYVEGNNVFDRSLITVSTIPRTLSDLSEYGVVPFLLLTHTRFSEIRLHIDKESLNWRASGNYSVMKAAALINCIEQDCGYGLDPFRVTLTFNLPIGRNKVEENLKFIRSVVNATSEINKICAMTVTRFGVYLIPPIKFFSDTLSELRITEEVFRYKNELKHLNISFGSVQPVNERSLKNVDFGNWARNLYPFFDFVYLEWNLCSRQDVQVESILYEIQRRHKSIAEYIRSYHPSSSVSQGMAIRTRECQDVEISSADAGSLWTLMGDYTKRKGIPLMMDSAIQKGDSDLFTWWRTVEYENGLSILERIAPAQNHIVDNLSTSTFSTVQIFNFENSIRPQESTGDERTPVSKPTEATTIHSVNIPQTTEEVQIKPEEINTEGFDPIDSEELVTPVIDTDSNATGPSKVLSQIRLAEISRNSLPTTIGTTTNPPNIVNTKIPEVNLFQDLNLVIFVSLGAVVICTISISVTICFVRRNRNLRAKVQKVANQFINGSTSAEVPDGSMLESILRLSYDQMFEIEKTKFTIDESNLLGSGTFGTVLTATVLQDNQQINTAVKTLRCTSTEIISPFRSLLNEIKVLAYVGTHPNIIQLIGAYTSEIKTGKVYVFLELCHLGSVHKYLTRASKSTSSREDSNYLSLYMSDGQEPANLYLKWSYEIASGMKHLAEKFVIHGDLATRNILLDKAYTAKICDFGLSRKMENYQNYKKSYGDLLPWRWMAIESLTKREFSTKSDVWSYGVTLWEIFSNGDVPFHRRGWNRSFENMLLAGKRLEKPISCHIKMYDLMESCWKIQPKDRPDFAEIIVRVLSVPRI